MKARIFCIGLDLSFFSMQQIPSLIEAPAILLELEDYLAAKSLLLLVVTPSVERLCSSTGVTSI